MEKSVVEKHSQKSTASSAELTGLRKILADSFILYMRSYAVHWNFEGPNFFSVHKLTEEHYKDLAGAIDEIAERIRAKGASAPVSLEAIMRKADLDETSESGVLDASSLGELALAHVALAEICNSEAEKLDEAGDGFSADMVYGRAGFHEKAAWMLKSLVAPS